MHCVGSTYFACLSDPSPVLWSVSVTPRRGGRSGGFLRYAVPRGADRAAHGLPGQPGGEPGPDQVPPEWAALHLRLRPGDGCAAGRGGGATERPAEQR